MANDKRTELVISVTGLSLEIATKQLSTGYLLDDADGDFNAVNPADHWVSMTEDLVIGGSYVNVENRQVWIDDSYVQYIKDTATGKLKGYRFLVVAGDRVIGWTNIGDLHDEAFGKWVLDPGGETLTLYKADGVTVLKTFNLTSTYNALPAFIERSPTP
ncbi:MAG: hypothetical protein V3T30_08855 [Thermodesulfobacteriota bacterium]